MKKGRPIAVNISVLLVCIENQWIVVFFRLRFFPITFDIDRLNRSFTDIVGHYRA